MDMECGLPLANEQGDCGDIPESEVAGVSTCGGTHVRLLGTYLRFNDIEPGMSACGGSVEDKSCSSCESRA